MLHHWVPLVWHYNKINWKIIMYSVLQKYYKIKILLDTYLYLELSKHYFFFRNLEGESLLVSKFVPGKFQRIFQKIFKPHLHFSRIYLQFLYYWELVFSAVVPEAKMSPFDLCPLYQQCLESRNWNRVVLKPFWLLTSLEFDLVIQKIPF